MLTRKIAVLLTFSVVVFSLAQASFASTGEGYGSLAGTPTTSSTQPCTPRIGVVTPDFIVLPKSTTPSKPASIPLVALGVCMGDDLELALVHDPSAPGIDLAVSVDTNQSSSSRLMVTGTFSTAGRFTVCSRKAACKWGSGPIIQVTAEDACGPVATGARAITSLTSESLDDLPELSLVARCERKLSTPTKEYIVDAQSESICLAEKPTCPGTCAKTDKTKRLQLDEGDTVRVCVQNKNPFRESFKLTNTDQAIKDDDIGSFLSLMMPSLGGGSSKSSDKSAASGKANANGVSNLAGSETFKVENLKTQLAGLKNRPANTRDPDLHKIIGELDTLTNQVRSLQAEQLELAEELPPSERNTVKNNSEDAKSKVKSAQQVGTNLAKLPEEPHVGKTYSLEFSNTDTRLSVLTPAAKDVDDSARLIQKARQQAVLSCVSTVQQRVDNLVLNYRYFAAAFNQLRNNLVGGLPWESAADNCRYLSNSSNAILRLVSAENEKILSTDINFNLRDVAAFLDNQKAELPKTKTTGDNGGTRSNGAGGNEKSRQTASTATGGKDNKNEPEPPDPSTNFLSAQAAAVKGSICVLKAMHNQVAPTFPDVVSGIEGVLTNPNAFVSSFQLGPYADPTQVDWSITKTAIKPLTTRLTIAKFNSDIDDCLSSTNKPADGADSVKKSGDTASFRLGNRPPPFVHASSQIRPQGLFQTAAFTMTSTYFAPAFAVESVPQQKSDPKNSGSKKDSSGSKGSDNSSDSGGQQNPSGPSNDDSNTTIRGERINFGAERFIVSIGMTGSSLGQKEFGKAIGQPLFDASGNSVTGQALTTIVVQKNDSSYRLSPMAFLNTRIYRRAGWTNATYATFGITAKSDSPGVRPEYLLGVSQSLFERHVLVTAGVYAGQQTSLAGGLKVNQAVPATLTGDLALNSPYHFSFGAGISWRVPGLSK